MRIKFQNNLSLVKSRETKTSGMQRNQPLNKSTLSMDAPKEIKIAKNITKIN